MEERISLLKEIGRIASNILLNYYGKIENYQFKGSVDILTEADKECEKTVIEKILSQFPKDSILAEESGETNSIAKSEYLWVIDPLDGTTNFAHGYPFFAFSCALQKNGETIAALVEIPFLKETFFAKKGEGAFLNEKRIRVSKVTELKKSLLVTGLPYFRAKVVDDLLDKMKKAVLNGQGLRRGGAAAVDLCYIACGRLDGYFEIGLKPWDTAAGVLIVEEAGGKVTDYSGNEFSIYGKEIVATNSLIHNELIEKILK